MKCLRIFATPDGESHFGEVDIPTTLTRSFPNGAPAANYESSRSAFYEASRVRFVHIPGGAREADFHNPPDRLLAIWLDGEVEFETSDGEVRRVRAGKAVLVEDTHGKGHISRHPPEGQNVIQVLLPHGLDAPSAQSVVGPSHHFAATWQLTRCRIEASFGRSSSHRAGFMSTRPSLTN